MRPTAALWLLPLLALPLRGSREEPASMGRGLDELRRSLDGAHVLLVVLDAAGARHFGCYGYPLRTTPEIDRIASEGVLFERAYTPASFTLAAMASLWTSLLPDEHHRGAAHDDRLPDAVPTLAELLSAQGIRTSAFVANWMAGRRAGLDRGFDEFVYVGYQAEKLRSRLTSWLTQHDGRQSFLYLHYREPHAPYDPGPPFDTLFGPAVPAPRAALDDWVRSVNGGKHIPTPQELSRLAQLYDGNLALADREVGWVRQQLEAAGLWERTVVIVTADHGEALYEHGFIGHGAQLYEETVRVPLVVRFPAAAALRGRRVAALVDLLDIAPTVADVFGLRGRGSASFRGRSLLPVALGAPGRGEVLVRGDGSRPLYALLEGREKLIFDSGRGTAQLFDLASDPGEKHDLIARHPLRAAVYRQRMHRLLANLPTRWTGPPANGRLTPQDVEELKALGYLR